MKDKRLVIKLKNNTAGALDSVIRKYSAYIYTVVYNVLSGKMTEKFLYGIISMERGWRRFRLFLV